MYEAKETSEQHYIMVGDQIKYEPALCSPEHRKTRSALKTEGNTKTLAGELFYIRHI